jgi:hypothetical protein
MPSRRLDPPSPSLAFATALLRLSLIALPLGCSSGSDTGGDGASNRAAAGAGSTALDDRRDATENAPSPNVARNPRGAESSSAAAPDAAAPASGSQEPASSTGNGPTAPPAPAQVFAVCTQRRGAYDDCDTIYVTMTQDTSRCVQLTIDNCGSYNARGLAADVPNPWRLASGAVSSSASPCELGAFYPSSTSVSDASGTISWNEATALPTEIVLDLTLELSGASDDAAAVPVATAAPLNPTDCAP